MFIYFKFDKGVNLIKVDKVILWNILLFFVISFYNIMRYVLLGVSGNLLRKRVENKFIIFKFLFKFLLIF